MENKQTNFAEAKQQIEAMGMTIKKTPGESEYRVDFKAGEPGHVPGDEGTAYFAGDLNDAVQTAAAMRFAHDERADHEAEQAEADRNADALGWDEWGNATHDPKEVEVPFSRVEQAPTTERSMSNESVRQTLAALDYDPKATPSKTSELRAMAAQSRAETSASAEPTESKRAALAR